MEAFQYVFTLRAIRVFELEPPDLIVLVPEKAPPSDLERPLPNHAMFLYRFSGDNFHFRHHSVYYQIGGWWICNGIELVKDEVQDSFRVKFSVGWRAPWPTFRTYDKRPIVPKLVGPESGLYGFDYTIATSRPINMAILY